MIELKQIAQNVAKTTPKTAEHYDQIWAIKKELKANGSELLATDRETIDAILDILFDEYGFNG